MRNFLIFIIINLKIYSFGALINHNQLYSHHLSYLNMQNHNMIIDNHSDKIYINLFENKNDFILSLKDFYKEKKLLLLDLFTESINQLEGLKELFINHEFEELYLGLHYDLNYNSYPSSTQLITSLPKNIIMQEDTPVLISETAAINLVLTICFISFIIHRLFLLE